MEDYKTYIESGILELYAMGNLTAAERLEVETIAKNNAIVATELANIEASLFNFANLNAVEPSNKLKQAFFAEIGINDIVETNTNGTKHDNEAEIFDLQSNNTIKFYKYGFAASITLLIISLATLAVLYNNLQNSRYQIAQMQINNQRFANRVNYLQNQVKLADNNVSFFRSPDVKTVKLVGTPKSPKSKLTVMWSAKQQKVLLDLNNVEIPLTDKQHQYQLWALVDGKPVDLGIFDVTNTIGGLKQMKNIEIAQTFAVTLEPRGGSLNPTMEQLMVVGNIL